MSCEVELGLLTDGISELRQRNKISTEVKTYMDSFIETLTSKNIFEITYSMFNQTASTDVLFTDLSRSVAWVSGDAELITNELTLSGVILNTIKLKATDQNVIVQISYDNTTWYTIDDYDLNESADAVFRLKFIFSEANTITGASLTYDNNV